MEKKSSLVCESLFTFFASWVFALYSRLSLNGHLELVPAFLCPLLEVAALF